MKTIIKKSDKLIFSADIDNSIANAMQILITALQMQLEDMFPRYLL